MKNLLIPNEETGVLILKNNPHDFEKIVTYLATSKIGILLPFRLHDNPNKLEFLMTLYFENPNIQNMVCLGFNFPVEVITLDLDGIVKDIFNQPPQTETSSDIRTFKGVRMVIISPYENKFVKKYNINRNRTRIELTNHLDLFNVYYRKKWEHYLKTESDCELIETFNNEVGIKASGFARSVYIDVLEKEIKSRSFNSDILFRDYDGLQAFCLGKKVKLENNKLIHLE